MVHLPLRTIKVEVDLGEALETHNNGKPVLGHLVSEDKDTYQVEVELGELLEQVEVEMGKALEATQAAFPGVGQPAPRR